MFAKGIVMDRKTTKHIMIVEDSSIQAESLKSLLIKEGYQVSIAKSAIEGLEQIKESKPDMVVSNILMPGIDGFEMCRRIKAEKEFQKIPVILLTALKDPKDIIRGLECSANDFISKPYKEEILFSKIKNFFLRNSHNEIYFEGQKFVISATREQILDFLISTYESMVLKNRELINAQEKLKELNEQLEEKINERTASLLEEIEERKRIQKENNLLIAELRGSLSKIKTLSGLIPICSYCKKIRDDKGYWNHLESFISEHSETSFTHSMCPECSKKAYEELREFKKSQNRQKG